jgi:hypothetical protein
MVYSTLTVGNNNWPLGSSCKSTHNNRIAPRTLRGCKFAQAQAHLTPNHAQRNRASMERNSNVEAISFQPNRKPRREAEATYRVLHGGPPPLHGGKAEPEAAVLSIGGELVRLGRAEVHPHLLLPPGPGSNPAPQQNHTVPSSECAQTQHPFPPRRRARLIRGRPPNGTEPLRIATARGENPARRGSDLQG